LARVRKNAVMYKEEYFSTFEDKLIEVMKTILAKELYDYIINYAKRNRKFREDFLKNLAKT
jgi:hypothetical protein